MTFRAEDVKLVEDFIKSVENETNKQDCKEQITLKDYVNAIEARYPKEDNQDLKKYKHYFKDVSNLDYIDIYRVISLWNVTDPCIQHAIKKLLVAGNRGYKDVEKDIQEAIDSLERWKEMKAETKSFNDKQEESL